MVDVANQIFIPARVTPCRGAGTYHGANHATNVTSKWLLDDVGWLIVTLWSVLFLVVVNADECVMPRLVWSYGGGSSIWPLDVSESIWLPDVGLLRPCDTCNEHCDRLRCRMGPFFGSSAMVTSPFVVFGRISRTLRFTGFY